MHAFFARQIQERKMWRMNGGSKCTVQCKAEFSALKRITPAGLTFVNRSMVMGVGDGYLSLISRLLAFKGRINLDRLKPAVEFTHVTLQAKALVRRTRLFLLIHDL